MATGWRATPLPRAPWKPGAKQRDCSSIEFRFKSPGTLERTNCRAPSGCSYSGTCQKWSTTRMLQWTSILGDNEVHTVANATENERSTIINLRGRIPTDESSLRRSSILAAQELTDRVLRRDQLDNHTTLVQNPSSDMEGGLQEKIPRAESQPPCITNLSHSGVGHILLLMDY